MKSIARIYKALADETRLRILLLLLENGELCICDLMNSLDMPQSTVSRHVAYMRNAGWLNDRRGGVWMYYSIKPGLDTFMTALAALTREHLFSAGAAVSDRQRLSAYLKTKTDQSCL
jgi:ArsR family transcriptional regulator